VRGNYREFRHVLAGVLDQARISGERERRAALEDLAFRVPAELWFDWLADRVHKARGGKWEEVRDRIEFAFDNPLLNPDNPEEKRPELAGGDFRAVLLFDKSPGLQQVGRGQYGKFVDGKLTDDDSMLELADGGVRRLEKLPVLYPELKGATDGWALVAYKPGQKPTEGVTNADGTPKNFRYVDDEERGKLILRAFAGQGSPGTVDKEALKRATDELRAAKGGFTYIEGVPVKRRFDGSFGVGWHDDARVLSGVAGEENAARIALKRANEIPPWGVSKGRIELPEYGQASPGTTGGLFDDFFDSEDPANSPAAWLKKLNRMFDKKPSGGKKKPKKKKPKKLYVGGKADAKPSGGPIPNYDMVRLEVGNSAGGSNGARWAYDKHNRRWLLKTYRGDQDRVATELLANTIYRAMGAKVAEAGQMEVGGKPALTYPTLEGDIRKYVFQDGTPSKALGEHFMIDALLANWDYVGMWDDNILWDPDGNPIRVDQGGTFEYRAMGQPKTFGPVPTEVWTMRTKGQAARAADVTEDQMRDQAREIEATLTPDQVDKLVDAAPFDDDKMRERVRKNLKARIGWMGAFARGEVDLPRPLEGEKADDALMKGLAKFDVFPEEVESVFAYTEAQDVVDEYLRDKKAPESKVIERTKKNLDGLFREVPKTTDDIIAWRGIDLEVKDSETPVGKDLLGVSLAERSFFTADLDPGESSEYAVKLRLVIPEGSHVMYVPALDDAPEGAPLLLPRNTKFRITGRRETEDGIVLDATVRTERPWGGKPWGLPPSKPKKKPPTPAEALKAKKEQEKKPPPLSGTDALDFLKDQKSPGATYTVELTRGQAAYIADALFELVDPFGEEPDPAYDRFSALARGNPNEKVTATLSAHELGMAKDAMAESHDMFGGPDATQDAIERALYAATA
jgi:hypothetical protein